MPLRVTNRMFVAAILLRYTAHTLQYEVLYNLFLQEFRAYSKYVTPAIDLFRELGQNQDDWFLFKLSGPYDPKTYDPHCEVRLNNNINTLESMRYLFSQTFRSMSEIKYNRDVMRMLSEAKHILTEKTESLRLPSFQNAFGYIHLRTRGIHIKNPGTCQLYDFAGEPYPY